MRIITHSGRFHTDEVFACAALSLLKKGDVEIVRSRDPKVWATGDIVVDVGGVYDAALGRFDHHQEGGAGSRENGIPYSSFGLIWKHYGREIAGSVFAAATIDQRLAEPIDAGDNGVETFSVNDDTAPYLLQNVIGVFGPSWNEPRTDDEGFFEALEIAKKVLSRVIIQAQSLEDGRRKVEEAFESAEDKRIIILDAPYPWHEVLSLHKEPLYAVIPDSGLTGSWKAEAVRDDPGTFQNRKSFPLEWAGKEGSELAAVSGVSDAIFCHNKRFIVVASSKEGAIALAKLAVEA